MGERGSETSSGFGDGLYRKRYLVTIIADTQTDGGDDWAASIGDGLGSEHCLWDIQEVESVNLAAGEQGEPRRLAPSEESRPDA